MKVIIAGSRSIEDQRLVGEAIRSSGFDITEVCDGGANGVDCLGAVWARTNCIPVKTFLANWHEEGKAAGPIRNTKMAKYADALIAVWDGKSKGTQDMVAKMKDANKPVYLHLQYPAGSPEDLDDPLPKPQCRTDETCESCQ